MKITSALFETFLKCPTKCYLRSLGETGSGKEYAAWVRTQDEAYEREAGRRLQETVPDCERVASLPVDEAFKTAKWRLAMNVVAQAPERSADSHVRESQGNEAAGQLGDAPPQPGGSGRESAPSVSRDSQSLLTSATNLESRLHAIERIPSEGRGKAAQFILIRFIWRNKLTKDDKLLLAFDAFVLSELLGREIALGKIIHGDLRNCIRSSRGNEAQTQNPQLSSPNPQQMDQSLLTSAATSKADARNRMDERQAAQTPTALSQARLQPQVLKVKTAALFGEVRKRIGKIATLLSTTRSADSPVRESQTNEETRGLGGPRSGPAAPDLVLNRHCAECEFRDRCRKIAVEKDDLSLLAGMSAKERQKLRSKGIFTVTQLSYTFRPRRRPKRQRDKREKYHHSLKALAIREQKIHIVGSPELKIEGTPVYLDVEGLPDRDFYYLIGLRIGYGESAVQHSLWADTVADEANIWREFLAILETVEKPVLIHYGSYETTFLKQMAERYGRPQEASVAAKAIEFAINFVSVMFAQFYFPTCSNGLKEIAGRLGFKWAAGNPSGKDTIAWREGWNKSSACALKQQLLIYNSEDCDALSLVVAAISELQRNQSLPCKLTAEIQVIRTEEMRHPLVNKWREFSSPLSELEFINKAAHWDYQRDRIYVRSTKPPRRRSKKKPGLGQEWRVDRVVTSKTAPTCPGCMGKGIRRGLIRFKRIQEIMFGRFSLKRRVIRYEYQPFWCSKCKTTFGEFEPQIGGGNRPKCGRSVQAYVFYHAIELYVPFGTIAQSLARLFGLRLTGAVFTFWKAGLAQYYQQTHGQILQRIIAGSLVHADETHVSIKGRKAYVWVLTNINEVAYLYSESREGEIIEPLLAKFDGVLVSDFYAVYDSFDCSQQKCLIHLVRDLNGLILDHPYDDELKHLIKSFGQLLKTIVEDVDRRGLKKRFLQKHLVAVRRFHRKVVCAEYQSPAALACRDRLEKNRDKLFTFLRFDGIPWNNNNAEHAMKAFARLRDVIEGSSTEKGIREYLILLSICQTCKYMGVDFLDFLRSGEKDIHAFAESRRGRRRRTQTSQPSQLPPSATSDVVGGA